jgi:Protein of unknwon function (DUF3310).
MKTNPDGTIGPARMENGEIIITDSSIANGPVNHPSYYNLGKIEVIDFIDDQKLGFYEAQVIKYITRAKHKGNELQDLKKAQWYLNRYISIREKKINNENT